MTENLFPHTVRWSICPVFTSLATFPWHARQRKHTLFPSQRHPSQKTGSHTPFELVFLSNRHPKATSMASYGRRAQAIATRRPDPSLLLGGPACRSPGIRSQQASQGHINGFLWASKLFSGRSSVPFARHSQPTGIPRPHQWLLMGVQDFSGRSSVPFARHSQPTGIPRPHQWLLMGVQAFSGRSSVPFARHSQPTGIPRPHQWFLMGVQACRLPAPKPLKPFKPLKPSKPLKPLKPLNIRLNCEPIRDGSQASVCRPCCFDKHFVSCTLSLFAVEKVQVL